MQLLLIPTALERERIPIELRRAWLDRGDRIELCGFGLAVSGILAMQWIRRFQPTGVVLLGIAGSYSTELKPGTACEFSKVSCHGIGVGGGDGFQSAGSLGWEQWGGPPGIGETIHFSPGSDTQNELLSVTSASSDGDEVENKIELFPSAIAEDMEGFAVAAACRLADVPLRIVRGISNYAGDRNHREWQIDNSLRSAMEIVLEG